MRKPSEIVMQEYYEKNHYVRLRVTFQVKSVGSGGYQNLRGTAVTMKLMSPASLWKAISTITRWVKEWADDG